MPETIPNLISTIIPVHNRAGMLREAVASVLAQTCRPIEIIISDDGSTDDTPEAIRSLAAANPDTIRFALNPKRGVGPARESGRLLARGEFIQYLDSDDRLLPRKFEIQVQALRERPECGAAYGYIRFCPEAGPPWPEPFKWSGRELPTLFPWLLVDRWWNTDTPLWRRTVCDQVGPWSGLRYSQDWEYDARAGALGTKLVHCREFVCEQRHHAANRQTGHGGWLEPQDRVRFFTTLFRCARAAGGMPATAEMKHFSRWMFLNARECGVLGDSRAARACWDLSVAAKGRAGWDLELYRGLATLVGWDFTGRAAATVGRGLALRPGRDTLKQSWMRS